MSGGRLIKDHSSMWGAKSKDSVFPKGPNQVRNESSASSVGGLNDYQDTTGKIKAAQNASAAKVRAHANPPMDRQ
jgi:hypothetical protein